MQRFHSQKGQPEVREVRITWHAPANHMLLWFEKIQFNNDIAKIFAARNSGFLHFSVVGSPVTSRADSLVSGERVPSPDPGGRSSPTHCLRRGPDQAAPAFKRKEHVEGVFAFECCARGSMDRASRFSPDEFTCVPCGLANDADLSLLPQHRGPGAAARQGELIPVIPRTREVNRTEA